MCDAQTTSEHTNKDTYAQIKSVHTNEDHVYCVREVPVCERATFSNSLAQRVSLSLMSKETKKNLKKTLTKKPETGERGDE